MSGSELEVGRWFAASPVMQIAGMVVTLFLVVYLTILGERRWRSNRSDPTDTRVGAVYFPPDRQGDIVNLLERIKDAVDRLHSEMNAARPHTQDAFSRISNELQAIRRVLSDIEQRKPTRRS